MIGRSRKLPARPPEFSDNLRAAADALEREWQRGIPQAPENDLHPEPAALAFRLKVLEDRISAIEKILGLANGR